MKLTNDEASSQFDYKYEIFVEHFVLFQSKVKNYTKFQTRMCENFQINSNSMQIFFILFLSQLISEYFEQKLQLVWLVSGRRDKERPCKQFSYAFEAFSHLCDRNKWDTS